MAKVKVKLNELRDADVKFVSLVDRAASRMPFRVIKRDPDGQVHLDLSKPSMISRILKGEAKVEITGVGIYQNLAAETALKDNGFDVHSGKLMDDGTVLYGQGGSVDPEGMPIKISDHMMVVVKGLDLSGTMTGDFAEMMSTRGFFGGLDAAGQGLQELLISCCYSDGSDQATMASEAGEVIDEFKAYIVGLIRALPVAAFKADKAVQEISMLAQKGGPGSGVYERNSENSKGSAQLSGLSKDIPGGKMKDGALHVPQGEYSDDTGGYAGTTAVSDALEKAGWTENPDATGESGYDTAGFMQYDKGGASLKVDFSGDDVVVRSHSASKKANDYIQSRRIKMNKTPVLKADVIAIEAQLAKAPEGFQGGADGWSAMSAVDKIQWLLSWRNQDHAKPAVNLVGKAEGMVKPEDMDQKEWDDLDDAGKELACKGKKTCDDPVVKIELVKTDQPNMKPITEGLAALTAAVTGLTSKIEQTDKAVSSLSKTVDENARKSEALAKQVGGVVVAPPAGGDRPAGDKEPAQKKDTDPRSGVFDTGMLRTAMKQERLYGRKRINIE